ncbi:MAG: alpha/beta hydrolase [Planctomycetes bacterium]|nr:alpha/beta hydrolase [Planctomycetota bacterium]
MAEPTVLTASDGAPLNLWRTPARGTPSGSVLMLHGIQSHAGWYGPTRLVMAERGWETGFLDRRGSGRQTSGRGDTPNWMQLVDDIAVALKELTPRPRVLVGISWGAKVALATARKHAGLVDAVALIAPGLCPMVTLPWWQRLGILIKRLLNPRALVDIPLSDPELFTSNPKWIKYLEQDRLCLHQATARFLVESAWLDSHLLSGRWKLPSLVQLAGRERIIDNLATRRWVRKRLMGPRLILEYPRACHTLEFEDDDSWRRDLLSWMAGLSKK